MTNFLDEILKKHESKKDKYNDRNKHLSELSDLEEERARLTANIKDIVLKNSEVTKIKESML